MCGGQSHAIISLNCHDRFTYNQILEYNQTTGIETILIDCHKNQRKGQGNLLLPMLTPNVQLPSQKAEAKLCAQTEAQYGLSVGGYLNLLKFGHLFFQWLMSDHMTILWEEGMVWHVPHGTNQHQLQQWTRYRKNKTELKIDCGGSHDGAVLMKSVKSYQTTEWERLDSTVPFHLVKYGLIL